MVVMDFFFGGGHASASKLACRVLSLLAFAHEDRRHLGNDSKLRLHYLYSGQALVKIGDTSAKAKSKILVYSVFSASASKLAG